MKETQHTDGKGKKQKGEDGQTNKGEEKVHRNF